MQEEAFAIPTAVAKTSFHHNFARIIAGSVCVFHKLFFRMAFLKLSDRCFCYFTAAMFVPCLREQT